MPIGDNFLGKLLEESRTRLEQNVNQQSLLRQVLEALEKEKKDLDIIMAIDPDAELFIALDAIDIKTVKAFQEAIEGFKPAGDRTRELHPVTAGAKRVNAKRRAKARAKAKASPVTTGQVPGQSWRERLLPVLAAQESKAVNVSALADYFGLKTASERTRLYGPLARMVKDKEVDEIIIDNVKHYFIPVDDSHHMTGKVETVEEIRANVSGFHPSEREKAALAEGRHKLVHTTREG